MQMIIHVGLPRTGSTFLQKEIFPNIPNVNFMYKPFIRQLKPQGDKINIISNENLCNISFKKISLKNGLDTAIILKKIYPEAKIILIIRNIEDWYKSIYNFTRRYDKSSFEEWYTKSTIGLSEFATELCTYVSTLEELFGKENVLILRYETLRDNPNEFVGQVCDFIGVDMISYNNCKWNPSHSMFKLWCIRQIKCILKQLRKV